MLVVHDRRCDIIVFENLRFRPFTRKGQAGVFKNLHSRDCYWKTAFSEHTWTKLLLMEMIQLKAKKKKLNKVKHFSISRLNISSLVCMVQALQPYPVMISLFVEKSIVLYNCTIVLVVFPYVTLLIKKNYFCLKPLFRWLNVRPLFVRYHSCLLTLTSGRS